MQQSKTSNDLQFNVFVHTFCSLYDDGKRIHDFYLKIRMPKLYHRAKP